MLANSSVPDRVWTWDDLWDEVGRLCPDAPDRLGRSAVRAVLIEAIDRERASGRLRVLDGSIHTPGYRRRLLGRFATWSRQGRDPRGLPPGKDRADHEEWGIFGRYRRLLAELGADDPEGFSAWAAGQFARKPPTEMSRFDAVAIFEPPSGRMVEPAVQAFADRAENLVVTLETDHGPLPREAFVEAEEWRDRLMEWEFEEEEIGPNVSRPQGLQALGATVFNEEEPALDACPGFSALLAPRGEGMAKIVARRVADLLEDAEVEPDDVLIVVARIDEESQKIAEEIQAWGVPCSIDRERPLMADPGVAALLSAMKLPIGGWEVSRLIRLLRNGQVRPGWASGTSSLAKTAESIRDTKIYRGRTAIRDALRRATSLPNRDRDSDRSGRGLIASQRASEAIQIFDRFAETLDDCHLSRTWTQQVDRLARLADDLGIEHGRGLDEWQVAIEDHGEVLARLGRRDDLWSWPEFARQSEAIGREISACPPPAEGNRVRVASIDQAEGAMARHVIVANMAEGVFPGRTPAANLEGSYPREMARFLRLIGSATETLTLVAPSADEKGNPLLASAFFDEVRRRLSPEAWKAVTRSISRLDPVLPAEFARSPVEARVFAVHRACLRGEFGPLDELIRSRVHREPLRAAARSLRLARWRSRRSRFGRFDGHLADPAARRKIAEAFAPGRPAFSASQLETFAACPFQFFQKYVLKLEPPQDREELDDDHTARGQLLHAALENLHIRLRDVPDGAGRSVVDRVDQEVAEAVAAEVRRAIEPASDIEAGLRRIEAERLRRTGRKYAQQFRRYAEKEGARAECRHFELKFGQQDAEFPPLTIGEPPRSIELQGVIDRIDLIGGHVLPLFRVIDYKTGSVPETREIVSGEKLQLSLYALAAQRVVLADQNALPLDAAYWGVREKGFQRRHEMASASGDVDESWGRFVERLQEYVLNLADRLRSAEFPVSPRAADCTRLCDYRFVCRIGQVRRAEKVWVEAPTLGEGR